MSYPELTRFDFHRNGNANRRDHNAQPRVLFIGMELDDNRMHFHIAGDEWVRTAHVYDAALDDELVAGMESAAALRLGIEFQRARTQEGSGQ